MTEKRRLDFLDILLTARDEHGLGLTAQEIQDEVDTFTFEGMKMHAYMNIYIIVLKRDKFSLCRIEIKKKRYLRKDNKLHNFKYFGSVFNPCYRVISQIF
jgi:hypothetical protein